MNINERIYALEQGLNNVAKFISNVHQTDVFYVSKEHEENCSCDICEPKGTGPIIYPVKDTSYCGVCGGAKVYIRGKYPHKDKRPICPTCAYERLEQIKEISDKDYGQAYQSK